MVLLGDGVHIDSTKVPDLDVTGVPRPAWDAEATIATRTTATTAPRATSPQMKASTRRLLFSVCTSDIAAPACRSSATNLLDSPARSTEEQSSVESYTHVLGWGNL